MRTCVKFNVLFVLLSVLFINMVQAQDSVQVTGPKIEIKETKYDFGQVPADTIVSHVFVIKNVGNDSLKIFRLKSG